LPTSTHRPDHLRNAEETRGRLLSTEPLLLTDDTRRALEARAAWNAVSAAFGALGRAFICADADFRVPARRRPKWDDILPSCV
jgi:hypothetical protein